MVKTNYPFRRRSYVKSSAVKRNLARKPKRVRIANPAKAILSNAVAVRKLSNQVNGHIQRNFQVSQFVVNPANNLNPMQPFAWCLNDFTNYDGQTNPNGGLIFKPSFLGNAPNIIPQAVPIGNFANRNPQETAGLDSRYRTWRSQNENTASLKSYQPLYAEYTFTFNRKVDQVLPTQWIRIDTLTRRRIYTNTTLNAFQMPDIMGAFTNMANKNDPKTQNCYNPALFNVKTRWLKLPQMDVTRPNATHTLKMKMGFPKKLLRLNLDSSLVAPPEPFHATCDPRQAIWCILSISDPIGGGQTGSTTPIETILTRKIVYRDNRGTSM